MLLISKAGVLGSQKRDTLSSDDVAQGIDVS